MTHASKKLIVLLALAAVLLLPLAAQASSVDILFTVPNTAMSVFSGTYATLNISVDAGGGIAHFTLTPGTGLYQGNVVNFAFMGKDPLGLNVNPSALTLTNPDYTKLQGDAGVISVFQVSEQFDGFGDFNTGIHTDNGGFVNAINLITFDSVQQFTTANDVFAALVRNNKNVFAAIDFAAYYPGATIAIATGYATVPVPPSVLLLGSGLLGLVGFRRKFRNN